MAFTLCHSAVRVLPSDPNIYFTEQNWAVNNTHAIAVNNGAYFKLSFLNSATVTLLLQPIGQPPTNSTPVQYMNILYSLDNGERKVAPVFSNTVQIVLSDPNKPLPSDDSPARPHTLQVFLYNSLQSANRWNNPTGPGGAALLVTGIALDDGATTVAPVLRAKRAVFFGDSITEGVAAFGYNPGCTSPAGDLCSNAATKAWGPTVAAGLDAEYSQIGFGGLGWSVGGGGAVVPLFVPNNPVGSSWSQMYAQDQGAGEISTKRSFGGIDYLFVLHATNDGLRAGNASYGAVVASATGWLSAVRNAVGPNTSIFLTIPFGGFGGLNAPAGALKTAFDAYQSSIPSGDKNTFLIDLGRDAAMGAECFGSPQKIPPAYGSRCGGSFSTAGGIHPRGGTKSTARHGELGAMLAIAAVRAMAGI